MQTSPLGGVVPVLQTPFLDDDAIDFDVLAGEIEWAFAHGADGLAVAMVSEVLRLATDEREQLAEFVCRAAAGRGPVVVSVGAESTAVASRLARHARDHGAAAVMAIPPTTTALDDEALYAYFARLVEAAEIPVVVQDASGYVGRPMSIALQARLCRDFADRVLLKPEAPPLGQRVSQLRDATGGAAKIFEGSGGIHLADSFRRGIVGTMPGTEMVDAIAALWRALVAGDASGADRLVGPIVALVSLQTSLDSYLAVEKHILVRRGVFRTTRVRQPAGYVLDDETRREVDRLLDLILTTLPKT